MRKFRLPQEIEAYYIVPAIRRQLVLRLSSAGLRQREIAQCLEITPSAVSQYLKSKRGKADIQGIAELLDKIKLRKENGFELIQKILKAARRKGLVCKPCQALLGKQKCRACL